MKMFCLIFLICIVGFSFASEIAQVEKVRGKVSVLRPGAMHAIYLKGSEKLLEDSSILTGEKSFIRLKYIDGSTVSLGPSSKIVLTKIEKKEGDVVSLLKGNLRSSIIPDKQNESGRKFYVRTRNAAMGVRGTEFHIVYSPESDNTSLVTYKGEVALVKRETELVGDEDVKSKEITRSRLKVEESKEMESLLSDKTAVVVKPGQYAGAVPKLSKTTQPVKIAPKQLEILYSNKEMLSPDEKKGLSQEKLITGAKASNLVQADQEVPLEGISDAKKGLYAPRAGGFIDIKSGLYIPPSEQGAYSAEAKVYLPENIGTVDEISGEYIPPKGLELDPHKGFILADNSSSDKKKEELLTLKNSLNEKVKAPEIVGEKEQFLAIEGSDTNRFDGVSFSVGTASNEISLTNINGSIGNYGDLKLASSSGRVFDLNYLHEISTRLRPTTGIRISHFAYNRDDIDTGRCQVSTINQKSNTLMAIYLGMKYSLSKNHYLDLIFDYGEDFYPELSSSGSMLTVEMLKVAAPSFLLRWQANVAKTLRFRFKTLVGIFYLPSKSTDSMRLKSDVGLNLGLDASYYLSPKLSLALKADLKTYKRTIEAPNFRAGFLRNLLSLTANTTFLF